MKLNQLRDNKGARRKRKSVGRGIGSGTGKTSGRGGKGQTARAGVSILGFEGGQMPLHRRLPKRGFNNPFPVRYAIVNVGAIQAAIDAGRVDAAKPMDAASLRAAGVIGKPRAGLRLLGEGELKAKIEIAVMHATKSAREAVEKAGGKITLLAPVEEPAAPAKA
ncbi:MAG: 50S ribosomal protein L15 [Alphaproteobacteria bacterium]|nr:50S ribosomal protein L15 [Alphaproteobacteria bacterium]